MRYRVLSIFAACACVWGAQVGPIVREGPYWVQTITGSMPASVVLQVRTRGPVQVQGTSDSAIRYTLRKRVRAAGAAEAARLLNQLSFRAEFQRGAAVLALTYPQRPAASADLTVQAPSRLTSASVETHGGDVAVYDVAGSADVRTGAGVVQADRIGGNLTVHTGGGDVRLGRIGGSVRTASGGGTIEVQRTGGESWFDTAGGEIFVVESGGPVHATTNGGNIRVGRAAAAVSARTLGGSIEVREAYGPVVAGNHGGSIQVGAARGVRLETNGGSIRLKGSSGALRAVSDVGSILAELVPGVRLQDSVLSTGGGDITVFIPANVPLTIKALNESGGMGRIVSEFSEIPVRQAERVRRAVLAEGVLNGGGPILQLTAAGGTIYLRRSR